MERPSRPIYFSETLSYNPSITMKLTLLPNPEKLDCKPNTIFNTFPLNHKTV